MLLNITTDNRLGKFLNGWRFRTRLLRVRVDVKTPIVEIQPLSAVCYEIRTLRPWSKFAEVVFKTSRFVGWVVDWEFTV
jgi:hypothetical protein